MSDVHGYLNLMSVTSGALYLYASIIIIFGEFYFGESKEPSKTRVIKFSRKLSILQYLSHNRLVTWRALKNNIHADTIVGVCLFISRDVTNRRIFVYEAVFAM